MIDLTPLTLDWKPVTRGATYPGSRFTESLADTDLVRVWVVIRSATTGSVVLTLDSDTTGVTINETAAGSWSWDIDEISDTTTASLSEQFYTYEMWTKDDADFVRVDFEGTWEISSNL